MHVLFQKWYMQVWPSKYVEMLQHAFNVYRRTETWAQDRNAYYR